MLSAVPREQHGSQQAVILPSRIQMPCCRGSWHGQPSLNHLPACKPVELCSYVGVAQAWHAAAPESGLLPPLSVSDESFLTYPVSALPTSHSLAWAGLQPSAQLYA